MQLKEISFEIIQKCPNNCIYCSSKSNLSSKHIISYQVYKEALIDALDLGLTRVCISGGEPFLHPEIINFVKLAKAMNLEVFIYTSGVNYDSNGNYTFLNNEILSHLKMIGLDRLIFNVQSPEEGIYDSIMGTKNCFKLLKTSIKNSVDNNLFCEMHFVPMKLNYNLIYPALDMAKELGINKVSFLGLVLQGRALQNRDAVALSHHMDEKLKILLNSLEYKGLAIRVGIPLSSNSNNGCNAGLGKLIIRYDGAVYPCEAFKYISTIDGEKTVEPDNVNFRKLKDIYNNSEFLNILRKEIKEFKVSKIECPNCYAQWRLSKVLAQ